MASLGEGTPAAPEIMTPEQLSGQLEALAGGVICYRAYRADDATQTWNRYAGKLEKLANGTFTVQVGPDYNYMPGVFQQSARATVPIPHPDYQYTRIVRASVWVTEFAIQQEQTIQKLKAELAAAQVSSTTQGMSALATLQNEILQEQGATQMLMAHPTIETDTFAFSPNLWRFDESGAMRLVSFLRNKFTPALQHQGQKHYAADAIATLQHLALLAAQAPQVTSTEHFQGAVKVQLKRLLISEMVVKGHTTAYISSFASVVDSSQMPTWVQTAQSTAATLVKSQMYTKKGPGN